MMNIYDLQQRAEVLRKRYIEGSITPEEVGGLIADTLEFISLMERNASSLGIVKVYNSFDEMNADVSPRVGERYLRVGQLVSIYNSANKNDAHNGDVYAYEGKTWRFVGNLASIALGTSALQAYPGEKGKALEENLAKETSARVTAVSGVKDEIRSEVSKLVERLQTQLNSVVGENATTAIENFNEIKNFLAGVKDNDTLTALLAKVNANISEHAEKIKSIEGESTRQEAKINQTRETAEQARTQLKTLEERLTTLIGANASEAIDNFNEVINFLAGVKDNDTLTALLTKVNERLEELELVQSLMPTRKEAIEVLIFDGFTDGAVASLAESASSNFKVFFDAINKRFVAKINGENHYCEGWFNNESSLYHSPEDYQSRGDELRPFNNKIYINKEDNSLYRWNGEELVKLNKKDIDALNNEVELLKNDMKKVGERLRNLKTRFEVPTDYFYGIEWDTEISNPKPIRIGRKELHASLPVQSLMRRCVLKDDGEVAYYLNANDSTKKENLEDAKLDGSDGQVMVELPTCYVRFETEGNKRRFLMSTHELPGFHKWEKCYTSAYEATIHRPTHKLSSVMNSSPDYRGGTNEALKDDKFSSQLGRPATCFNLYYARASARNRGSANWNCHTYQIQKQLFWFFAVEYCNFNSQDDFNASLDDNGYRQGGLGKGVTHITYWDKVRICPVVPCGISNSLGNKTGVVEYNCIKSEDDSIKPQVLQAISYRGIENPFGHTYTLTDGAKCIIQSEADGGKSMLYVCDHKEKWNSKGIENYEFRGFLSREGGYIKELILGEFGEIMPSKTGAGSTTFFCDYLYTGIPASGSTERIILFGGSLIEVSLAGFAHINLHWNSGDASPITGTRLSFIP